MIRFISWNIQWGRGADGVVNLSRVADEIRRLGDFDVICLQEVASRFPGLKGGSEEDGIEFFRTAFPDHALVEACAVDREHPGGGRSRFGNVLLSRLPVETIARHRLPSPPDPGRPSMPRSVVEVVLGLPGDRRLRVLTTHLEYYSGRQRSAQIAQLRDIQRDALQWSQVNLHPKDAEGPFARPAWPVAAIVCGDFNCRPGSADWVELQVADGNDGVPLWQDAWPLCHGDEAHPHSVGLHGAEWPDHPYCCDFFFVSPAAAAAVAGMGYDASSAASDHQPVLLEMKEAAL